MLTNSSIVGANINKKNFGNKKYKKSFLSVFFRKVLFIFVAYTIGVVLYLNSIHFIMSRFFTITLLLSIISLPILANQDEVNDSVKTYQRLDATYVFGGQVYKNNFVYKPGFSLQVSHGFVVNESVNVGAGLGYVNLKDEHFLPVFIEVLGSRKRKQTSPTIKMQIGYAPGWDTGGMKPEGYHFRGGMYISAGLGRKIPVGPNYSLYFHWSYRHQFARSDYKVFGGQKYTEDLNYDMFVISLGLIRDN